MLVLKTNPNYNALSRFYGQGSSAQKNRPDEYNLAFSDGDKKAPFVIDFLHRKNANFDRLAYVLIGGADGAEIVYALQNTGIKYGILLEYSNEFCEKARKLKKNLSKGRTLYIESGDAFSNRVKAKQILEQLHNDGLIDGVVITSFSVFHELPYRSIHTDYDFRDFIIDMVENMPEVYFYTKEPCDFQEWKGTIKLSVPKWFKPSDLKRFADTVQQKLSNNHTELFKQPTKLRPDGVLMSAELGAEVVKKIVYFLKDKNIHKLTYELQESHSKFNSVIFAELVKDIFSVNRNQSLYECDTKLRYDSSDTFSKLYDEIGINVESVDKLFFDSILSVGFFRIEAFYRKKRKLFKGLSSGSRMMNGSSVIETFYSSIEKKTTKLPSTYFPLL